MNATFRTFALVGVSSLLCCVSILSAQTAGTATLVGTVTDASGALVAGAKVTVTNVNTSFVAESVTTAEGTYYAPYLAPGAYRLGVEAAGFKRFSRDGIQVRTGETPRIDVQLEVGAVTEAVNVSGAPVLLETETAASGQVLDGDLLVKVPVSQKRAIRILFYMPGANAIGGFTVLGQRAPRHGLHGRRHQRERARQSAPPTAPTRRSPPRRTRFQEVKLYTTGSPAELGHSAGGLMSIVFKSGTNQLHGSVEDRFIGRPMIHRSYLEQLDRTNPFAYHETTLLFSGPLNLPKLYHGRDKTFWLAGFERH